MKAGMLGIGWLVIATSCGGSTSETSAPVPEQSTDTEQAASMGEAPAVESCSEYFERINDIVASARSEAPTSCLDDADCILYSGPACGFPCGVVAVVADASGIEEAVAAVDAACREDCSEPQPPSCGGGLSGPRGAECRDGQCAAIFRR